MNARPRLSAVLTAFVLSCSPALTNAAFAAQSDLDLLKSYVGDWRGRGTVDRQGKEESVVCKLEVSANGATKIILKGACSLAGGKLTWSGTMAYLPDQDQFIAVISSNTDYSGQAVGKRGGDGIVFDLREIEDKKGKRDVSVAMALRDDVINVDFKVTDAADGKVTHALVPLSKRSATF